MHAHCRNATALIVGFLVLSVLAGCSNATTPPPTGSTIREIDINPGIGSSNPNRFTLYNGNIYFSAIPSTNGTQLMMYDGTNPPSTISSANFNPSYLTVFGSSLYMDGNSGGNKLFSYDGSTLVPVSTTTTLTNVQYLQVYNGDLYMTQPVAPTGTNYGLSATRVRRRRTSTRLQAKAAVPRPW